MKNRVAYYGLFLVTPLDSYLSKKIEHQHITMIPPYMTAENTLPYSFYWNIFEVEVVGYANDGTNEGFEVKLPDNLLKHYLNKAVPHITVSVSNEGKPVNTGKLIFEELTSPFKIKVKAGAFINGKPVY